MTNIGRPYEYEKQVPSWDRNPTGSRVPAFQVRILARAPCTSRLTQKGLGSYPNVAYFPLWISHGSASSSGYILWPPPIVLPRAP